MLLEHERNYGLGMDARITVGSWNRKGIMVWAWMLLFFEHERNYGQGMGANGSLVWAWML